MEIEAEIKTAPCRADLNENTFFDAIQRLRKTDNILLITNIRNYPIAKNIITKYPEMRIRIAGIPGNLPANDSYAWLVMDLNDLQVIYNPGD